jgi:hypothetical protein
MGKKLITLLKRVKMNQNKSKSVEVIELDGRTEISVYPRFLKGEKPTKYTPSIITLEGDKMIIKLDLDLNIKIDEEDDTLGINLSSEKNFSLNGIWYTKKQHIGSLSSKVDKFVDDDDEDKFEFEYIVTIAGISDNWGIRTKDEKAQEELLDILTKWFYHE